MEGFEDIETLRSITLEDLMKLEGGAILSEQMTAEEFEILATEFIERVGSEPSSLKEFTAHINAWCGVAEMFGKVVKIFEEKRKLREEAKARRLAGIDGDCRVNIFRMEIPDAGLQANMVGVASTSKVVPSCSNAIPSTSNAESRSDVESETKSNSDAESETKLDSDVESETKSNSDAELETNSNSDAESETKSDSDVGSETKSSSDADSGTKWETACERAGWKGKRGAGTRVRLPGSKRLRSMRGPDARKTVPWTRERDQDIALFKGLKTMTIEAFKKKIQKMDLIEYGRFSEILQKLYREEESATSGLEKEKFSKMREILFRMGIERGWMSEEDLIRKHKLAETGWKMTQQELKDGEGILIRRERSKRGIVRVVTEKVNIRSNGKGSLPWEIMEKGIIEFKTPN